MKLSPHFYLREFTRSDTAARNNLDNAPTVEHLKNLKHLASQMEKVRKILGGNPVIVTSGYRNPQVNKLVGGVPNSDHALGLACDFSCPRFGTVEEVCRAIADSNLEFDQLIFEQGNTHWVHLGFGTRNRRQVLSWSRAQGYVNGVRRLG